ncbi:MAG: hypothetical protein HY811_06840 [Planctomycetes bacterium]|nr:hypothetical protein [Planctomycetota bacterium]
MKKKMIFLWIEDNQKRQADYARTLENKSFRGIPKAEIDFKLVRGMDIKEVLDGITKAYRRIPPNLIIIDHFLDNIKGGFIEDNKTNGTSIALLLREKGLNCPIVGITTAANIRRIPISNNTKDIYDDFIDADDFEEYFEDIFVLANAFRVSKKVPSDKSRFLGLLKTQNN